MKLVKAYEALRKLEKLIDAEIGSHQKDPTSSEIETHEYQEFYHALSCITDAEQAFFGGLMCVNERKMEEDEWWISLEEYPEMQ